MSNWLTLDKRSGTGDETVTLTASNSTEENQRTKFLRITSGEETITVIVKQKGTVVEKSITVSPTSMLFEWDENEKSFTVVCDGEWEIIDIMPDWVTVTKNAFGGTVNVGDFVSRGERTGTIYLRAKTTKEYATIDIKQTGIPYTTPIITPESITLENEQGSTAEIYIDCDGEWSLTAPFFVDLSETSGSGSATVTVTTNGNNSGDDLNGLITVNGGNSVSVTQKGGYDPKQNNYIYFTASEKPVPLQFIGQYSSVSYAPLFEISTDKETWGLWERTKDWSNTYTWEYTLQPGETLFIRNSLRIESLRGGKFQIVDEYKYYPNINPEIGYLKVGGKIGALLDKETPESPLTQNSVFSRLFSGVEHLRDASDLKLLPAIRSYTYEEAFKDCKSLISAPTITGTVAYDYAYQHTFEGCISLRNTPTFAPTTLRQYCYRGMFYGCTGLIQIQPIKGTTLGQYCCYEMFSGCTSLLSVPSSALPAMALSRGCYLEMFNGCTNLRNTPELPATTLAQSCYQGMFSHCSSMTSVPDILPATELATGCYNKMFNECSSLRYAPELPAETVVEEAYQDMFYDCSSLNQIKALFTERTGIRPTENWVYGVSPNGTFVKKRGTTIEEGVNGIPSGWTVIEE